MLRWGVIYYTLYIASSSSFIKYLKNFAEIGLNAYYLRGVRAELILFNEFRLIIQKHSLLVFFVVLSSFT